jgi:hypothetical protein
MVDFANVPKSGMTEGRTLPLVQDTTAENVGDEWDIEWRDLYILDADGRFADKINLTDFNPDPAVNNGLEYQLLKWLLLRHRQPASEEEHIHFTLRIVIEGQDVPIPANVGLTDSRHYHPQTHAADGVLHVGEGPLTGVDPPGSPLRPATLEDFFDVWRTTNVGASRNNPAAFFSENQILDRVADAGHSVQMTVNGQPNFEFENYSPRDGDQVVISFVSLEDQSPWRNPVDRFDVDANGSVFISDLVEIVSFLRQNGTSYTLPAPSADAPPPYVDLNGDGVASIIDLVLEVQELRRRNSAP